MPTITLVRLWPLPALLAWAASWAAFVGLRQSGMPPGVVFGIVCGFGASLSLLANTRMRALVVAAGFPVSVLAQGALDGLPGWAWLLPLALLALVYPLHAWRDAPLFPTPAQAFDGLSALAPLPEGARVLDAGCGLGHGLAALRRAYPHARLEGIEWSWPLALLARARCRWASVQRGDMWAQSWRGFDMVYVFQRPESMAQALLKAGQELKPGGWLVSLEFEATGGSAQACLKCADGRPVWLYRMAEATQAKQTRADKAQSVAWRRALDQPKQTTCSSS